MASTSVDFKPMHPVAWDHAHNPKLTAARL